MSIVQPMIFIFIGGMVLGYSMAACSIFTKYHSHVPWRLLTTIVCYSLPALLGYSFVMGLILSLLFPCRIASNGIYGYSFGGTRGYLGWADIASVKKGRLGNLHFLRLFDNAGHDFIWLPLFQSRRVEFENEIRRLAPPNHPVLSQLS